MERRLSAIVAADVVGYSRLIRSDEDGTLAALRALRAEIIDPAISEHNGRVVKLMGDGILAEFPSVVDAVACSAKVQQAIAAHMAVAPDDRRIVFRIGVNLGDVVIDGDDIHGDGVNVASRLEAIAAPGAVCIAGTVHELVRDRLDLAFEDLGDREVKNIDRPVRVWQWGGDGAVNGSPTAGRAPESLEKPSIAVLPFDNLSPDPDQDYFADGLVEDVITALSRNRGLFVIARNGAFAYRRQNVDIRQIGRELGVRYVVEGSVRRAGNRVRITVQLIEAVTGNHVWAERYDRPVDDLFDVQDEITANVAGTVGSEIRSAAMSGSARLRPQNLKIWESRQKAAWHLTRLDATNWRIALEICREEIANGHDAFYEPLAYALAMDLQAGHSGRPAAELIREGLAAGRRAVEHDPRNAGAYCALCNIAYWSGDLETAKAYVEEAIAVDPNFTNARMILGSILTFSGPRHVAEAREQLSLALRLGPRDQIHRWTHFNLGMCAFLTGDHAGALQAAMQSIKLDPGFGTALRLKAAALAVMGRTGEATAAAEHALETSPIEPEIAIAHLRRIFRRPEDAETYIAAQRLAGLLPS